MYSLTYFYIFVIVLCWTLNPFIKKMLMTKMDANEYLIINHSIVTIVLVFYLIYLLTKKRCNFECLKKLSKKEYMLAFIGGITTILATLMLMYLVSSREVSFVMGNVQPLVILLSIILGYLFFKEEVGTVKVIGMLMIIGGLILINSNKTIKAIKK